MSIKLRWLIMFTLVAIAPLSIADDEADREAIRVELEHLVQTGFLSTGQVSIAAANLLEELYERRSFLPTWNDQRQIKELIEVIKATEADGLDPADYHVEHIEFVYNELLAGRLTEPQEWAPQDLVLTDSLARLGYHQKFGKVNPYTLDPNWNFRRDLNDIDPATVIQAAIDSFQAPLEDSPERHYQRVEAMRLIQVALDRLPAKYGNVLEWKYVEGHSVKEIAARLEIGAEATQSLLARAKRAFADVYTTLTDGMNEHADGLVRS